MTYDENESKDTKTNSPLAPKQDNSWVKSLPEYQQPSFKSRSLKQNRADRPEPARDTPTERRRKTMANETPIQNDDIRHKAAGNLAFLLSVIRCGEPLHADEEAHVREIIDELESAAAAPVPQLSVDAMAAKMAEYDENWTVSYGRGTKLWTIVIPWHDIKVHSKKLTETFELAEAALAQAREKGVK